MISLSDNNQANNYVFVCLFDLTLYDSEILPVKTAEVMLGRSDTKPDKIGDNLLVLSYMSATGEKKMCLIIGPLLVKRT